MERSQAAKRWLSIPVAEEAVNNKRTKSTLSEPAGHGQISFRMLCHASRVGGIIGKSGLVIQQLQLETLTKIRIEDAPADCIDRVILITGSADVKPSVLLIRRFREGEWGEEVEISAAQEGLLRVFEKVLEVAAETDGAYIGPGRVVSCRLIVKGGIGTNIRAYTTCRINVYPAENSLPCAEPTDDLLEIEGEVLAVKRALVAISRCIQDHECVERNVVMESRLYDSHREFSPREHAIYQRGSSLHAPTSSSAINHGFNDRISPTDSLRLPSHNVERQEEVSFRILCSNDKVGSVIGKGGSIIQALKSETGAVISIGPIVDDCEYRLITVKATENLESQHSQAQKAMVLVFSRFGEASYEKGTFVVARLIVPKKQIGCLLGKGGVVISEMRKTTRTCIHILKSTEVPKCASDDDQVVEITGEFVKVQDGIYHVTSRLRDNMFPRKQLSHAGTRSIPPIVPETRLYDRVSEYAPVRLFPSDAASHNLSKHSNQLQNSDYYQFYPEVNRYVSPGGWTSQTMPSLNKRDLLDFGGVSSSRRGMDLGSGGMAAFITNTTIEIKIPDRLIGSVYGESGSNLARLRQISGARVMVQEPHPCASESTVVISGTPDETQAAQSLLQAFILTRSL